MFARNSNFSGGAQVAGGRVGQYQTPAQQQMPSSGPVFSCGANPASCNTAVQRTVAPFDLTPATTPFVTTAVVSLIPTSQAAGFAWGVTLRPKCPVRVLALYFSAYLVANNFMAIRNIYVGATGQRNFENLLGSVASAGDLPIDAFADLNACVPLFDIDVCITPECPLIIEGTTTAAAPALTGGHQVRGMAIVERC